MLQTYDGDGALQSSYIYGRERIADVKEANTNYFMLDELGSVMALTDEKGNVVSHYDYDEFGVPALFDNLNKGGNRLSNIFGYTGEEYDEELGLLNLRARNYEPETGRFLERDPYEVHWFTAKHKYGYGYNNPLKWIDPLGMAMVCNGGGGGSPPEGYHRVYYVNKYGNRVYTLLPNEGTSSPWSSHGCITPFELTMMAAGGFGSWIGFGLGGTLGAFAGNFFPALYAATSTYARWREGEATTDQLIQALGGFLPGYSLISLIISILSNPNSVYVETETFF